MLDASVLSPQKMEKASKASNWKSITLDIHFIVLTLSLPLAMHLQVDPEPYVEMCVEAACSCPSVGDCACFCDVIAAYGQVCSEKGVSVSWRSNYLCREWQQLSTWCTQTFVHWLCRNCLNHKEAPFFIHTIFTKPQLSVLNCTHCSSDFWIKA